MCSMLVDAGGARSVSLPFVPAVQVGSASVREPARSGPSGAARHAADLQRQLAALHEQARRAQQQAEAARKQAIEAQRNAQKAQQDTVAARALADRTHQPADQDKAEKVEQDARLADAQLKQTSAKAALREREVTLLQAKAGQVREQKHDPAGTASARTDKEVHDAQQEVDTAKETDRLCGLYAQWQEAESRAQNATPVPEAMQMPGANPTELRVHADTLGQQFSQAMGADAQAELFGPQPAAPATPKGPARSALDQLLQLSPFPALDAKGTADASPVSGLLADIADGKSLEQIAQSRCTDVNQLIGQVAQAGIQIQCSQADGGNIQITTLKQGGTQVTYAHDLQHGEVNMTGSAAAPGAKGTLHEMQASRDGNGRVSRTVPGTGQGGPVTQVIDTKAGTRTDIVVSANGRRTETTTDLTGIALRHTIEIGDKFDEVAHKVGRTPKQLQALNPGLTAKDWKAGHELVIAVPQTTVREFRGDGSTLETKTAPNGDKSAVFVAAGGRRTTLAGPPEAHDLNEQAVRKGIFNEGKTVAQVAAGLGLTQAQALACLGPGSVDTEAATFANGDVQTRRIYDAPTNTLVIETHDNNHGAFHREVIDAQQTFKVRQVDADGKTRWATKTGGEGHAQQRADTQQRNADDIGRQINALDGTLRIARRMGDPVNDLLARRSELVAQRGSAQLDADVLQGKATQVRVASQQQQLKAIAGQQYQAQSSAAPGSAMHKEATAALGNTLATLDKVDRLADFAAADVALLAAGRDQAHAKTATRDADQHLEAEYQKWKRGTWTWGDMSEQDIQRHKDAGIPPPGRPLYRNDKEEDEAARRDFDQLQKTLDEARGPASTGGELPYRDAWLARNQAHDHELQANVAFKSASMAQQGADQNLTQGDIDRLTETKNAWMAAHPDEFSETFSQQGELDKLQGQVTQLSVSQLQDGEDHRHGLYLLSLPAEQRHYAPKLEEAEQRYQDDHQVSLAQLATRVTQLTNAAATSKAVAADDFIARWNRSHPELREQLDALDAPASGSVRAAEHRADERAHLLASTPAGRSLKAALAVQWNAKTELTRQADENLERIQQDLKRIDKSRESHTWVRDAWSSMFGDTADDVRDYTQGQRDAAKKLQDDFGSGAISLVDLARREDLLMAEYGVESVQQAKEMEDSDGTWSVVDEAVRTTAIAAAGIGATILSGGNVAIGFGVSLAVAEGWDTVGDGVAMAQGKDIYADGHSSLGGLGLEALQGDASWADVRSTLKDEAIDVASSAVTMKGVSVGMKTTALLGARLGGREALGLGQRALVGAASGTASQGVDGAGRVGVETLRVGLDGKLGTQEGDQRILGTLRTSAVGLVTAPLTGGMSAALPLRMAVPGAGAAAQFVTEGVSNLGTQQLTLLATEGRGMNKGEFIAASVQTVSGTLSNVAMHPLANGLGKKTLRTPSPGRGAPPALMSPTPSPGAQPAGGQAVPVAAGRPVFPQDMMLRLGEQYENESVVLEGSPAEAVSTGIRPLYLSDQARDRVRLTIGEDGLLRDANGDVYSTPTGVVTQFGKPARHGYVMDRDGSFYPHRASRDEAVWAVGRVGGDHHPIGKFDHRKRHSSALEGGPVAMAGLWEVKDGVVHAMDNRSGHYLPTLEKFKFALRFMRESGLDLSQARIVGRPFAGRPEIEISLNELDVLRGVDPAGLGADHATNPGSQQKVAPQQTHPVASRDDDGIASTVGDATAPRGVQTSDPVALAAALAAGDSYNRGLLNPQGSRGLVNWRRADDAEVRRLTGQDPAELERIGLGLRVYLPGEALAGQGFKPMVVFRGAEVGRAALPNWRDNVLHGLGRETEYDRIAADIGRHLSGQDVLLVGHSLGGRLAAVASRTSGRDAITFNAAGVNKNVLQGLPDSQGHITAFQLGGDPLTLLQDHTPLASAPGEVRTLPGPRRGTLTLNHLMGPVIDSMRRSTPSGKRIDADLLHRTQLSGNDPRLRKLLRGLDRAGTPESQAAAELIRSGELRVNVFKRDPLGVKRDGFYVEKSDYIGITVPRSWLMRPQRIAGIAAHEAVHYVNRGADDPHAMDIEVHATRAQGAVDPRHWSRRIPDDADLRARLEEAAVPAPGGDSVASTTPKGGPGFRRVATAVTGGAMTVAAAAAGGYAVAPHQHVVGPITAVALGTGMRNLYKLWRFRDAHGWNKRHREMRSLLTPKKEFEHQANLIKQAGDQQLAKPSAPPAAGTAASHSAFDKAFRQLAETKPQPQESTGAYRTRVEDHVDELAQAAEAIGVKKDVLDTATAEMKDLADQKVRFDRLLDEHERFLNGKMGGLLHPVKEADRDMLRDKFAQLNSQLDVLRDGNPTNDDGALAALSQLMADSEFARYLRPGDSALRKGFDLVYGATYGLSLGAFVHAIAGHDLKVGVLGAAVTGVAAAGNAFDALRIGSIRFDELMSRFFAKSANAGPPAADSALLKKWLTAADETMAFAAGLGIAGLAIYKGVPHTTLQDLTRMVAGGAYAGTSGARLWTAVRDKFDDPDPKDPGQRDQYLRSKKIAAAGGLILLGASLYLGGSIEPDQPPAAPANAPAGLPVYPPDEPMPGHRPLPLRPQGPMQRIVTTDGDKVDTSGSMWAIASSNLDWILTPQQQSSMDGPVAVEREATQRLSQFNGFNPRLMDGKITSEPGDPDLLPDGWKVNVNALGLTGPPNS